MALNLRTSTRAIGSLKVCVNPRSIPPPLL